MSQLMSHLSHLGPRSSLLTIAGLLSGALGCVPLSDAYECRVDDDCLDSVCSRDGECVLASELLSVRLSWTLCGTQATSDVCQSRGVSGLRIVFGDADGGGDITYEPVLCELGQIYFDRMSPRYEVFDVALLATAGSVLDSDRFPLLNEDNVFEIDFAPRAPTDPPWCAMLRAP